MHSIQRAYSKWKSLPGNWDVLHLDTIFPSDNDLGIPTMDASGEVPSRLVQWGSKPQLQACERESAVHFFIDDYRFECLWKQPARYLDLLIHVGLALSPDFSLFRDMPIAMQIWNVYRNRWLGCFWQANGISVIPTISWSKPYDFCYFGVEQGSPVAISTVGIWADPAARYLFREGFEKMVDVLKPACILCYGKFPKDMQTDIPISTFPTRWEERIHAHDTLTLSLWDTPLHGEQLSHS